MASDSYDQLVNGLKQQDPNKPSNVVSDLRSKLFNPQPRPINPPVGYATGGIVGEPPTPGADASAFIHSLGVGVPKAPAPMADAPAGPATAFLRSQGIGMPRRAAATDAPTMAEAPAAPAAPAPAAAGGAPATSEYGQMMRALAGLTHAEGMQLLMQAPKQYHDPRHDVIRSIQTIAAQRAAANKVAGMSADQILANAMKDLSVALAPNTAMAVAGPGGTTE